MFIGKCERLFEVLKGLYVEIRHTIPSGLTDYPLVTCYRHKFPSGIPGLALIRALEGKNKE